MVVLTWQFPPPSPCFFSPSTYISASLYPLLVVASPTVLQNENVSPGFISLPFKALHVIVILFCLSSALLWIFVENSANTSSCFVGLVCSVVDIFSCSTFFVFSVCDVFMFSD